MKPSRPSRYFAALVTLFCLLFTQLALASYACPKLAMPAAAMNAPAAEMGDMGGCEGMGMGIGMGLDMDQPGLCKAHCEAGNQSLDTSGQAQIPSFVPVELVVVLFGGVDQHALANPSDPNRLTRTTAPPLAIRNCCFRI
ncbi:hypothetical protein [Massilia glaciei]|uniref:Copper resistance protein n=1 Tax=Massilia glaciei TaxID=1524097 RepID=A0A2U2HLP9_9BURK|nr:hypothetical protein [Massilia glaciei]PWF48444.1 hypothetical protein C7C56_011830 [Massilia glaciei]